MNMSQKGGKPMNPMKMSSIERYLGDQMKSGQMSPDMAMVLIVCAMWCKSLEGEALEEFTRQYGTVNVENLAELTRIG